MKKNVNFTAVFLLALSLQLFPQKRPATIDDLMKIRNVQEAQISPKGDSVAYVIAAINLEKNISDSDIWLIGTRGGSPLRLTYGSGRDESPHWSPDENAIAFISDRDGRAEIWLINPRGGEAFRLTDIKGGVSSFAWSPNGEKIAFLSQAQETNGDKDGPDDRGDVILYDQDPKGLQISIADVRSRKIRLLTQGPFSVTDMAWSPDSQKIAVTVQPSPRIPDLYSTDIQIIDLETGQIKDLVRRKGVDTFPRWSPDGRRIAFLSTEGSMDWIANWYLCLVPSEGGMPKNVSPQFDEFLFSPQWSPDGAKVFFQSCRGFRNALFSVTPESGQIHPLTNGDSVWSDFSFSKDGSLMAFLGTDPLTPEEVYVSAPSKFNPVRLTSTNPQLESLSLGLMETVRWRSTDGLEIEGLLLKPVNFVEGKKYPLLTYIHGGPSGRFSYSFSPQISSPYPVQAESYPLQVFSAQGHAVFMPNPRGSYGYGEKFRKANVGDWGGGDYQDVISGIDNLVGRGIADPERLGIMGRSYGGYLTAWIISQTNRFKAASLGAGMSNLASFYGQTDIPGYMEYYFGGVPWIAKDRYERRSPIVFAQNFKTPTLILHGEKDFRVPVAQAQELYTALKRSGVPAQFVVYPRQGHVVLEPRFMSDMLKRSLEWFNKWIPFEL